MASGGLSTRRNRSTRWSRATKRSHNARQSCSRAGYPAFVELPAEGFAATCSAVRSVASRALVTAPIRNHPPRTHPRAAIHNLPQCSTQRFQLDVFEPAVSPMVLQPDISGPRPVFVGEVEFVL